MKKIFFATLHKLNYLAMPCIIVVLISCYGKKHNTASPADIDSAFSADPYIDSLPSWNDGILKTAILTYVKNVTDSPGKDFIPVPDRIATFDNDGTLWAERPYVQGLFTNYRIQKMIEKNPALAERQPFKTFVERDKNYLVKEDDKRMIGLIRATHTGMTDDEFESSVKDFFATATYPGRNVPLKQIRYAPQVELLNYLRAHGFKTFICTSGTIEFMRGISQEYYGIPKDQVIGTSFQYFLADSNHSVLRRPGFVSFNDKNNKPVMRIGKRPVFACGNEGGADDIAMLEFSQGSKHPSFQMIIDHNDSAREFYYQEKDSATLKAAARNNWHVASMKYDWKTIFTK